MKSWQWLSLSMLAVLLFVATVMLWGRWRWQTQTGVLLDRMEVARAVSAPPRFDPGELEGLPPPVRRYLESALSAGMPMVSAVSMAHSGSFNVGEVEDNWRPFTSEQRVTMRRPGFVWDARVSLLPGLSVHVHDAYVAGEGILRPAIAGVFTLIDLRGGGDIAQGEFMRWLAESPWYPTVLLPSQGARWQAVDERSARVTLGDGALSQTLTFVFGDDGLVSAVRAEARGRTVGRQIIATPWEGRWYDYAYRDGMRVPLRGEVAWLLPEGRKAYWRGEVRSVRYEFAS